MATSPLFGWEEPDDVDLVKDGAAAIRTLGNAIDTSMGDLLGGTTGQVLAKASNTNMDFTWVAQDDSNAIQNAIVDAKGDLIAATAADTPARLAVGTNGQVLTADSTASTGLAWATPSAGSSNVAGKNAVLNSNFSIWQRSTSAALGSAGVVTSADRWATYSGNASTTLSRQVTGDTTNLPFIQYCGRMQRTAGSAGTNALTMANSWETVNSIPYAGKTVTFSFYARAGANYSATSNAFEALLRTGTGTDQNYTLTGYTGSSGFSTTATLTTTWQRFSVTGTVASNVTEIATEFRYTPTGTAGANDYAEVTGVQVEIGSSASAYSPNTSTQALELAACQRYFNRAVNGSVNGNYRLSGGNAISSSAAELNYSFPVTMRTSPTLSVSSASHFMLISSTGGVAGYPTSISGGILTPTNARVDATGAGGLTGGNATALQAASSSATLDFSAEL